MADFCKVVACVFSYLLASILSVVVSITMIDFFWPNYDVDQQSSGPLEQQFYLLLVDRGYWMTGHNTDSRFRKGTTQKGRERFTRLLNDVSFQRDCLGGTSKKDGEEMECTVNGKWIYFVN